MIAYGALIVRLRLELPLECPKYRRCLHRQRRRGEKVRKYRMLLLNLLI